MGKIIPFIILISIVWQVISSILEAAAKKKEAERLEELSSRSKTSGGFSPPKQVSISNPAEQFSPTAARGPSQTRAEALAARRKAQLAELRQRRGGSAGQSQTSVRVGGAQATPPTSSLRPQSPPAPTPAIHSVKAGNDAWRQELQDRKRKKTASKRRHLQEVEEASGQRAREQAARVAKLAEERKIFLELSEKEPSVRTRSEAVDDAYHVGTSRQRSSLTSLVNRLKDRDTLREMIIIKELLDVPVSMRQDSF